MATFNRKPFNPNPAIENFSPGLVPIGNLINPYQIPPSEGNDPNQRSFQINNNIQNWADFNQNSNYNDKANNFAYKSKMFGRGIVSPLKFSSTTDKNTAYMSIDGTGTASNTSLLKDIILESAIITVKQDKNIIKTKIMGKDGTIKEYIGLDDYTITIEGMITGINGQYPLQDVMDLEQYLNLKSPIFIVCPYLSDVFGIASIVIESYEMPQTAGDVSQQKYKIIAKDDRFYEDSLLLSTYPSSTESPYINNVNR